jgi:hypothetical protein
VAARVDRLEASFKAEGKENSVSARLLFLRAAMKITKRLLA